MNFQAESKAGALNFQAKSQPAAVHSQAKVNAGAFSLQATSEPEALEFLSKSALNFRARSKAEAPIFQAHAEALNFQGSLRLRL